MKNPFLLAEFRFALVGAFNTAFGFASFTFFSILLAGLISPTSTLVIATIPTLLVGFLTQKLVVWTSSTTLLHVQIRRFLILSAGQFAINYILLAVLAEVLLFHVIFSQLIATLVMVGTSYLGQKLWVFRSSGKVKNESK